MTDNIDYILIKQPNDWLDWSTAETLLIWKKNEKMKASRSEKVFPSVPNNLKFCIRFPDDQMVKIKNKLYRKNIYNMLNSTR